jgi:hypothetical protein
LGILFCTTAFVRSARPRNIARLPTRATRYIESISSKYHPAKTSQCRTRSQRLI